MKKNKKIIVICLIVVIILIALLFAFKTYPFCIKEFYKEDGYTFKVCSNIISARKGGRYFAAKMYKPQKVFISEIIISNKGFEVQDIKSIIHTSVPLKSKIEEEIIYNYLYTYHDETPSCGIHLNNYKKSNNNYIVDYSILGEC